MIQALTNAQEELQTTNSYLYGLGVELADIAQSLNSLDDKLDKLMEKPIQIIVDTESLSKTLEKQKAIQPSEEATKFEFKPPLGREK